MLVKKFMKKYSCIFFVFILFGCNFKESAIQSNETSNLKVSQVVNYEVEPESFTLSINNGEISLPVSSSEKKYQVKNFNRKGDVTSWEYPEDKISVSIKPEKDYLYVSIISDTLNNNQFQWPNISGEVYYMPFGEGKRIPASDKIWNDYLKGNEFSVIEQLSMPFWVSASGDHAVLYIMENSFRNNIVFSEEDTIKFSLVHQYPEIDSEKENNFRIYLTDNNPVSAAKIYRQFVIEQENFVTLEQKADKNENVRKMYGAPQIYLWGDNIIAPENINWNSFRKSLNTDIWNYIMKFAPKTEFETEVIEVVKSMINQDYVDKYQKNIICRFLSEILKRNDFYNSDIFIKQNEKIKLYLEKGIDNLDESNLIQFNKQILYENLADVFFESDEWMNKDTVDLIRDLKNSGIEQAWIGLNSWEQAYAKPELVETAISQGYLVGPYDSYHSIHEPEKEKWITAKFKDISLYDNATVSNKNGEKIKGFQNIGRKLNPVFSMPAVKQRVEEILSTGIDFNSWFIDCDATGEIYDDYTSEHITTQQEDLKARLERISYIRDQHNMVVGSEGGNDFAASDIVFAHGIELKSFSWIDEDMKNNKESKYYIGNYYNPSGGVAEHFSKRIPIKEKYYNIFLDSKYDIPLFKLVYNNSVITSYHWDWSTFKIIGAVKERMMKEILYNIAPLYHLDNNEWTKYKNDILSHTKIWSSFSKEAVKKEMTDFKYLKEDGSVQMCEYGKDLFVVANFGSEPYLYLEHEIPSWSLLINIDGKFKIYTPEISEKNM